MMLLNVCQSLVSQETTSLALLSIVLKFLVDDLPLLGEYDDMTATAMLRLYRMAFVAATNEVILASHVGKLLMDCFPITVKATKPTNYYLLLRTLFRAIGVGGGRYQLSCVLPS